jgi:hypothetical protein
MCGCNGGGGGGAHFGLYGNRFFLAQQQALRRQGVNRGSKNNQAIQAVLRARINALRRFGIQF